MDTRHSSFLTSVEKDIYSLRSVQHASPVRNEAGLSLVIAVHGYYTVFLSCAVFAQRLGDSDRAVLAAGAADADDQIRLAFRDIARQQKSIMPVR